MHEYSIVEALVRRVEAAVRERSAVSVHQLEVSVGELSGVDRELLATAYETFRGGTVCERAVLKLRCVNARWRCLSCQREVLRGEPLFCGPCGTPASLVAGDELTLDRVELEVD